MFSKSAQLYDLIYSTFKDYSQEAERIAALLHSVHPASKSVLDVACGTGEHARLLNLRHGFEVDGIDLNPDFVLIAQQKNPSGRFHVADMAAFDLGIQYDVITCLFSSIGYLLSMERVKQALRCFRKHLTSGGVIIVEPWFVPGVLEPDRLSREIAETPGLSVERIARTVIEGRVSRLYFDYFVRDGNGIHNFSEVHELGLFTPDEMMQGFAAVGLTVQFDPEGLTGRGLYIARLAP